MRNNNHSTKIENLAIFCSLIIFLNISWVSFFLECNVLSKECHKVAFKKEAAHCSS